MTRHLTPGEFIDALDASSGPSPLHLAACAACRRTLDDLRRRAEDVSAVPVPDPSPLFWVHFSQRVRQATTDAGPAHTMPWLSRWRRMAVAGGVAVVATAVFAFLFVTTAPQPTAHDAAGVAVTSDTVVERRDPESLAIVEQLLADLSIEDVQEVAVLTTEALLVEELDAEERTVFVRLVGERMEAAQ